MLLNPDLLLLELKIQKKFWYVITQHSNFFLFQPLNLLAHILAFLYHTIHKLLILPTKHNKTKAYIYTLLI